VGNEAKRMDGRWVEEGEKRKGSKGERRKKQQSRRDLDTNIAE